jgi:hypothetical protein
VEPWQSLLIGGLFGALVTWLVARYYYEKTLQAARRDKEHLLSRIAELEGAIEKGQDAALQVAQLKIDMEVVEKGLQHAIRDGTPDYYLRALNLPEDEFQNYRTRILALKKRRP